MAALPALPSVDTVLANMQAWKDYRDDLDGQCQLADRKYRDTNYRRASDDDIRKRKCVRDEWRCVTNETEEYDVDETTGKCIQCGGDDSVDYVLRGTTTFLCSEKCFKKLTRK